MITPLEPSQNAGITSTCYQHLRKLYQYKNSVRHEENLIALPQSFHQQILDHISEQAGSPVEANYEKAHLVESSTGLQRAVKTVATRVLRSFNKTERDNIARKIYNHTGRTFSEDRNWEENHVTNDIPLLLQTMHNLLGDLTPELQKILDEWSQQGESQENRAEAKDRIINFLKNPNENSLNLSGLNLKSLPHIFDKQPFIFRLKALNLADSYLLPEQTAHLRYVTLLFLPTHHLTSRLEGINQLQNLNYTIPKK